MKMAGAVPAIDKAPRLGPFFSAMKLNASMIKTTFPSGRAVGAVSVQFVF
jgi:hypothetical protein